MMRAGAMIAGLMGARRIAIAAAVCMVSALGCARQDARVAMPHAMSPTERSVRDLFAERRERVRSLRALGRVSAAQQDEISSSIAVAVRLPDRMRIDAIDSVADVTMAAGANGSRAWVWLPHERRLVHGRVSRRSLGRMLGIDMNIGEFMYALAGVADVSREDVLMRDPAETSLFRVRGRRLAVMMDERRNEPRGFIVYEGIDAEPRLTVLFDDYGVIDGVPFPRRITAYASRGQGRVTVEYDQVELNAVIADGVFEAPRVR